MEVRLVEVREENCPAARLIGKRYAGEPNWGEWWEKDWFAVLEKQPHIAFNGDAYLGGVRIVNGMPERWIGMLFPAGTEVPDGFAYADLPPLRYAVCYLSGREGSDQFYTMETHDLCLRELEARHWKRRDGDWCFERYNCPRFTTPDASGNVVLDYAISIEDDAQAGP